ncbi:FMN-dependent dehydrogenase-domain-containing protein [Aspergillus granulosus]|uniref:FMN-dependent dehydrogenase-domain-containing protein n=1 Tax=Aspergillus granulosus TaxID=176169 RepID=A0ABR4GY30_9EURO
MADPRLLSVQEILRHDIPDDCWLVISGEVWDLTSFANEHPGGAAAILKYAGHDATEPFLEVHAASLIRENLPLSYLKGNIDPSTISPEWKKPTSKSQCSKSAKPPLQSLINSHDFQRAAALTAPPKAYAFYSTADTDCWTRDANESMLKRIFFRPRVMCDVSKIDLCSSMLGIPMSMPLFICPTGVARLIHPDAEKGLARAAKSMGILEVISTNSGHPLNEVVAEAPDYPFFFQLYLNKDRSKSHQLLKKVELLGLKAIFLTVDAAGRGKRESDERLKSDETIIDPSTGKPVKATGGLTRVMGSFIDQSMTWDAISWIRSVTNLPIILKGITRAEDAKIALQHKVDGIVVSNHGGRNLDYSPPSILVLLELHKNCPEVFDKMEVYVDGGFRRGSDILKALCLGARAVGIGRSFLFALSYGTEGVKHLIQLLRGEMESAMKLLGIKDLSEVHPGLVNTSDVDYLVPSGLNHPYVKWRSRPYL